MPCSERSSAPGRLTGDLLSPVPAPVSSASPPYIRPEAINSRAGAADSPEISLPTAGRMKVVNVGCDPSEVYRPEGDAENGKSKGDYRNFKDGPLMDRVYNTYLQMHTNQTVDFVQRKNEEYGGCHLRRMTIMEALDLLDNVVDESDPDVNFPNSYHAYQTAEGIRRAHPDKDWFHLVGLLHDIGKILALVGEPQWAVVGDTFPVGCKVQDSVVFRDSTFHNNPDMTNPLYNTKYGIYQPHCGLENVLMSWGHDEYMYKVMKHNKFALPQELVRMQAPSAPNVRLRKLYWKQRGRVEFANTCLRLSTWSASTLSIPGTQEETTCTCAMRMTSGCCPG
uniref:Inositol oxygenase n=1 Tax=Podarcis muralis TaxID=64176 RepID=A0A670JDV2_PODMU